MTEALATEALATGRRWYDRDSKIGLALRQIKALPDETAGLICQGVNHLAEREFRADQLLHQSKSLGKERVLALFKSQQRLRREDQIPSLHQALNYLTLLSDPHRDALGDHASALVDLVQEYQRTCDVYCSEPSLRAIEAIADTYAEKGRNNALLVVAVFQQAFRKKAQTVAALGPEEIRDYESDLGIGQQSETEG